MPVQIIPSVRQQPLNKDYRRVWVAATISSLGSGIVDLAALPLLVVLLTDNPLLIAGVFVMVRLPGVLLCLPAGVAADRFDRKRIMITANAVRAVIFALLGVALIGGWMTIGLIYICAFIIGAAKIMFEIAELSVLPSLLEDEELERGTARMLGATTAASDLAGLPLGGVLFSVTASLPFLANCISFVFSALLLKGVKRDLHISRDSIRAGVLADTMEGIRQFRRDRTLMRLALITSGVAVANAVLWSLIVLYITDDLNLGPLGYSLVLGLSALGSIAAGLKGERIAERFGATATMFVALSLAGIADLLLAVKPHPVLAVLAMALSGYAILLWNMITVSMRIRLVPIEVLGRINSVWRLCIWTMGSVGGLLAGLLASLTDVRTTFFATGLLLFALLPLLLRWPSNTPPALEAAPVA